MLKKEAIIRATRATFSIWYKKKLNVTHMSFLVSLLVYSTSLNISLSMISKRVIV